MTHLFRAARNAALALIALVAAAPDAMATDPWARLIPHGAASYADEVDFLYYLVYAIVMIVWVGVQGAMCYFLIKYRAKPGDGDGPPPKARYYTGNHLLELIWTLTPAAMLLFIALIQREAWMDIKTQFPDASAADVVRVQVRAQRFNWDFRYAGKDGKFNTSDDFTSPVLVVPVKHKILLAVRSKDVLHSFFLPHMRVKQDTVPGLTIPIWFEALMTTEQYAVKHNLPLVGKRAFKYEIVCAELCGNMHFNMRGTMDVVTRESYDAWVASKLPGADTISAERKARRELCMSRRYVGARLDAFDRAELRRRNKNLKKAGKKPLTDAVEYGRLKTHNFKIIDRIQQKITARKKALTESLRRTTGKQADEKLTAKENKSIERTLKKEKLVLTSKQKKIWADYSKHLETVETGGDHFWGWSWPAKSDNQKTNKEFQ